MGAIGGEELMKWEKMDGNGNGNGREEKILVLMRLRPLNEKEISRNDVSDWECINDTTVLFRNSLQERSMFPAAYSFASVLKKNPKKVKEPDNPPSFQIPMRGYLKDTPKYKNNPVLLPH
ncbi:hypothetical protein L6452_18457 [Arctium lappa]|uniref:Uncharacterized protein n=1 Tax=Arctium lappa TaxID=4217 RepID=A0ACB9C6E4_ARCLA|nr:hypothetical protein L6452_18457 [Arctium lappa]